MRSAMFFFSTIPPIGDLSRDKICSWRRVKWQRLRGKNKPSKEQKQNSGDNLSWIRKKKGSMISLNVLNKKKKITTRIIDWKQEK